MVVVCGPVPETVLGWCRSGVADDAAEAAAALEAEDEVGIWSRNGADGQAWVASDAGGCIGCVWDGCRLLNARAVPTPMYARMESCFCLPCNGSFGKILRNGHHGGRRSAVRECIGRAQPFRNPDSALRSMRWLGGHARGARAIPGGFSLLNLIFL